MIELNNILNTSFIAIRDIPYNIPTTNHENLAGCSVKSLELFKRLSLLRLKVAIGMAEFEWGESLKKLNIRVPNHILQASKKLRGCNIHTFLAIIDDNKYYIVDPTWDIALSAYGFPVNKVWRMNFDMELAIFPQSIRYVNTIDEYMYQKLKYRTKNQNSSIVAKIDFIRFAKSFNSFLNQARMEYKENEK